MQMSYTSYKTFDEATGFSTKAGFQLTAMQSEDAETFAGWRRSLNTYEVGGGKTVVATVVSLMLGGEVTIVTVPPILIRPWVRWLNKVSDNVVQYQGKPTYRHGLDLSKARWVVCSHAIFRDDFGRLDAALRSRHPEVIVDEAHAIKNPQSVLFKKVQSMSAGSDLQMLTGTPTSKPADAYAYIKLKSPQLYRSVGHFERLHVAERDHFGSVTKWQNLDVLAENFSVQRISRTKEEIHGYKNEPLYPDCSYQLSTAHKKLYERLVEEQLLLLDDGTKIDATTAQRLYHNVQQIILNYDYFSGDDTNKAAGYDLLDSVIDQTNCVKVSSSKLIVWTLYRRSSRSVLKYLTGLGIKAVAAYSEADSQKSIDLFMDDPATRILVGQYQSCGAGLNPQGVCWESLFLETGTTPLLSKQALGRLDRVGQTRRPTQRFGVAEDTVQVSLLARLLSNDDLVTTVERTKKSLRDMLLGGL